MWGSKFTSQYIMDVTMATLIQIQSYNILPALAIKRCVTNVLALRRMSNVNYSSSYGNISTVYPQSSKKSLITTWTLPGMQGRYCDILGHCFSLKL